MQLALASSAHSFSTSGFYCAATHGICIHSSEYRNPADPMPAGGGGGGAFVKLYTVIVLSRGFVAGETPCHARRFGFCEASLVKKLLHGSAVKFARMAQSLHSSAKVCTVSLRQYQNKTLHGS